MREISQQRINICLLTVLIWGKSPGRAEVICLHKGCQLWGFPPQKANFRIQKRSGHFLDQYIWPFKVLNEFFKIELVTLFSPYGYFSMKSTAK
jgi:hypothetical protein